MKIVYRRMDGQRHAIIWPLFQNERFQQWHLWGSQTTHHSNALSSTLKLCCPGFHCAIRRRLLPKGFHEVFMNFLGRYFFLTEVLDNRSDFKFLHFANVSHPPLLKVLYMSNQTWPHAFHTPNRSNDNDFNSMNLTKSHQSISGREFFYQTL